MGWPNGSGLGTLLDCSQLCLPALDAPELLAESGMLASAMGRVPCRAEELSPGGFGVLSLGMRSSGGHGSAPQGRTRELPWP